MSLKLVETERFSSYSYCADNAELCVINREICDYMLSEQSANYNFFAAKIPSAFFVHLFIHSLNWPSK